MPNYLKQILHTQIFSVLNIIIGFISLFLLIKYMPISEYGEYVLIQGFLSIGGLIFSQNLYSYARLHIPGAQETKQYAYLKTIIIMVLGLYGTVIILSNLLDLESYFFNFFELNISLGYFILCILGFQLINNEFARFFITIKRIHFNDYAQVLQKIFILMTVITLHFYNYLTLKNFLYFFIIGQFLIMLYFFSKIKVIQLIQSSFMIDVLKKGYQIGLPLLPVGLMSIALNYTDTVMISKFVDKEQVAQYGFTSQIINIAMMMIGSSIVLTLFPYATEAHNNNDIQTRTSFFVKMYKLGTLLAIVFYLLSILNIHWIVDFFNLNKYNNVPMYLTVLAIFPFFQLLYSVSSHNLQLIKIFNVQMFFAIIIIIENIILNYYFIQEYGAIGAAYASFIAYLTLSILYLTISLKKDYLLFYAIKKYLYFVLFGIPFLGLFSYLFIYYTLYLDYINILISNILVLFIAIVYFLYLKKGNFL